jgi:hypothetical protein
MHSSIKRERLHLPKAELQTNVKLNQIYNILISKDAYRFFAGLQPITNICSINSTLFSFVVFNCVNLLDNKHVKIADLDLEFIATKAGGASMKSKMNHERQLIRY